MHITTDNLFTEKPTGGVLFALRQQVNAVSLLDNAVMADIVCREIDGEELRTEKGVLLGLAECLRFGSYYGKNWDALDECLGDREFTPRGPTLLIVHGADKILNRGSLFYKKALGLFLSKVDIGKEVSGYAHFEDPAAYPPFWMVMLFPDLKSQQMWASLIPREIAVLSDTPE